MTEREIFVAAIEIAERAARHAYVLQACGEDSALRERVQVLLETYDQAGSFLESPPPELAADSFRPGNSPTIDHQVPERPGTVIGPYKLMEQIGEGGFGLVFVAEQHQPVRRKVALKIIKPGMDTRDVIARFEAERQALALMDHPNIAKVFDAGTTDAGRPYFVMELVRGVPITDFCDQRHLSPRERLALFVSVCHAIQHAHQKGIIHRDVKPTNVLVTLHDDRPVVKVIDFGVAKALSQQLTERTIYTQFAHMLGTPLYMSPEQAEMRGLDIDTRSDIYSLGVLLYELLTGATPFDRERLKKAAIDEIRRIIREEEPLKPSTRLSQSGERLPSIAAVRATEPARLAKLVRGDLDWIVMKCLEKDRNRRYETANGLARDIERYLHDLPVEAGPPSVSYRLRKFARRNKAALATSAVSSTALLVIVGIIGWAVRDRIAREQEIAREREAQQAVLEHEVRRALATAATAYRSDKLPEAIAAVNQAEGLLAAGTGKDALASEVRRWRTDLEMAARLDNIRMESADRFRRYMGETGTDRSYLRAFEQYGLDIEALAPSDIAARIRISAIKERLVTALDLWTECRDENYPTPSPNALLDAARLADPDPWRDRVRNTRLRKDPAPSGVNTVWWAKHLESSAMEQLADVARMEEVLSQSPATVSLLASHLLDNHTDLAIELLRKALWSHPGDYWINWYLGMALRLKGRPEEAHTFFRVALAIRPDLSHAHYTTALNLVPLGPTVWEEAAHRFREAIRLDPTDFSLRVDFALLLEQQGRFAEAGKMVRKAIELGSDAAAREWLQLGRVEYRLGNWQASIDALEKCYEIRRRWRGNTTKQLLAMPRLLLAMAHHQLGDHDEAIEWYDMAIRDWPPPPYGDKTLVEILSEAAELLGLPQPATDQSTSASETRSAAANPNRSVD